MTLLRLLSKLAGFTGLLFCAIEIGSRLAVPVSFTRQISVPYMYENSQEVGYKLRKNMITRVRAWDGKKDLFHVKYQTDQFGRRIIPLSYNEMRNRHFVILGGSTVFGMGLRDEETLSYFLGLGSQKTTPYNYACDGYGPQNAYAQLKSGVLQNEVPEEDGEVVFFFQMLNQTGGHIQTLLGRFELLLDGWGESLPMYTIEEGKLPQARGPLREFAPFKFHSFKFFQNFHSLNLAYPKLDPIDEQEIKKTIAFMKALATEVKVAKPKSRFLIVIHPLSDRRKSKLIAQAFAEAGLTVVDFSDLVPLSDLPQHIAFNRYFPHPNGKLNALFADALISKLSLP
jgi:hypothetical protein